MKPKTDIFILIVIGLVFFNSLLWATSIPFNGAPDEYDHFRLAAFIAGHNRIPVLAKDQDFYFSLIANHLPVTPEFVGYHEKNKKYFERSFLYELKPVYMMWPCGPYVGFALFLKIFSWIPGIPLFYFARFFSGLCASFIVFFVYDIVKRLVPEDRILPKMTTLFVAFLPQFTFLSAYVNPDIVTALVATLILRTWFFCLDAKWSTLSAVALGIALGLGILSKISGYSVLALTALFLFFFIPKEKNKWQYFSIVLLFCFLTSGWFFIRNQILYHDWTGYVAYTQQLKTFLSQAPRFVIEHDVFSFLSRVNYGWRAVPYLFHFCFSSFWGVFSWMSLPLPNIFYTIAYGLTGFSIAGLVVYFAGKTKTTVSSKMFLFMLMVLGSQLAAIGFYVAMIKYQPQGRYFYPVIAPLAFVFCFGLLSFFKREPARRMFSVGFSAFMVGLNLFSFLYCQASNYFLAFK